MTTEMVITLVVGLFGGGSLLKLVESILDRKSWLKRLEAEMKDGFDRTDAKIEQISARFEEHKAIMARVRILRFSDDVRSGRHHSKESFHQVLSDIDAYEDYCALNPRFENNKTVIASKVIIDRYKEALDKNEFL